MIFEKSCGAIVYKIQDGKILFLVEKMKLGHFSFPKGHMEPLENEVDTATREIKEETNLSIELNTKFRQTISYSPKPDCIKEVVFFLAKPTSNDIKPQEIEVSEIFFMEYLEAVKVITHKTDKKVLDLAYIYILSHEEIK